MTTNNIINRSSSRLLAILVIAASSLLATSLIIGTFTTTTTQMAYADFTATVDQSISQSASGGGVGGHTKTLDIQSAEPSEGAAHTGEITKSLTVDPENREGDEPALHREMTHILPNDRIMFRVVESAPQSSNAAAEAPDDAMINQNTGQLED